MSNNKNSKGDLANNGYQPSKAPSHPTKDGYSPAPTSERAPAPPPKNP